MAMNVSCTAMLLKQKKSDKGDRVYMSFIEKESGELFQISAPVLLDEKVKHTWVNFVFEGMLRTSYKDGKSTSYFAATKISAERGGKGE